MVKISEVKEVNLRHRYYRLRKAVLKGVPELKTNELIKLVEISAYGRRDCLMGRNKAVRRSMAERGVVYEHCFCGAVTEKDGLCRLKGLLRLKRSLPDVKLLEILQEFWCKRLKTDVKVIAWSNELELRGYIRNEVLQAVADGDFAGKHLVMSSGWKLERGAVSGNCWFHMVWQKVEKPVAGAEKRMDRRGMGYPWPLYDDWVSGYAEDKDKAVDLDCSAPGGAVYR